MTVVDLADADDERRFGGKAAELGAALRAGLPVPDGLAVSHGFVEDLVSAGEPGSRLLDRVSSLDGPYVVRSSGVGEDSEVASFAGQHLTVVNLVDPEEVNEALEQVRESGRTDAVLEYRSQMGLDEPPKIGAVIQTLVDADTAGVLFSENPVDGSTERVIEATWGLGEAVVDSMVTPDYFRVRPGGDVLERRVGTKDIRVTPATGGGTQTEPVPDAQRARLCLTDAELRALDRLAGRCDTYRSGGHDIEWAFAEGTLFLLQRRDITTT